MKLHLRRSSSLSSLFLTLGATAAVAAAPAWAQTPSAPPGEAPAGPQAGPASAAAGQGEIIIVTGTRTTGLTAEDSPAPVVVLGDDTLEKTGQPDLIQALAQNVPSFTAQAFGGDTSNLTLKAKLRGLSPNHALVLLNGKRVHGTSNLSVPAGPFQGGAGADLSYIPVASIERVEVLLDGAAAQYGSDAIAGVINIIQKRDPEGGQIKITGGEYFDGGGNTAALTANWGWEPFENAWVNFTAETKYHGDSFRGDVDPRVLSIPTSATNPTLRNAAFPEVVTHNQWPYTNRIPGDATYRLSVGTVNAGWDISDAFQLYAFGSYGYKWAQGHQNYRLPTIVVGKDPTDRMYPLGFDPRQELTEQDFSYALGAKGGVGDFTWDLASIYGRSKGKIDITNSGNADYYRDTSVAATPTTPYRRGFSPSEANAGALIASQWTTTLDLTQAFDIGWAEPLVLAGGLEYRRDYYEIRAGDPITVYKGGMQSYYGFQPFDASKNDRGSYAVYADLFMKPIDPLTINVAGRFGSFDDFGDTTVGKLTSRYDFSDAFGVRATVSTGFRAPTLAEGFYSGTNVSPSGISGQLAPNSPGARLIGTNGLKPEESVNYSVGLVARPVPRLSMTLDAYQIEISDRIVGSGSLRGSAANPALSRSPAILAALAANGVNIDPSIFTTTNWTISASLFTNGLDTKTTGVDFVATYPTNFGSFGEVDWSLAANYSKTEVTSVAPSPPQLTTTSGGGVTLFDRAALTGLETTSPEYRVVLGAVWTLGQYSLSLKESYIGEARQDSLGNDAVWRENVVGDTFITDIELGYEFDDGFSLAIGANNLFNEYPDEVNAVNRQLLFTANSAGYATKYPAFSPIGINGGYYYAELRYDF
jgi:iron complex outermembrane recepter protein